MHSEVSTLIEITFIVKQHLPEVAYTQYQYNYTALMCIKVVAVYFHLKGEKPKLPCRDCGLLLG